ncbi:MAG: flagellar biosynthetic protein FliO [Rickettsiales bacterium]|nr:flagellar biosynthetic protein FliO [Rickettsiales bacterium]
MDLVSISQVFLAFAIVVGLILLVGWITRKANLHHRFQMLRSADKRLSVISSLMIDPRRRLVLIKRDEKEHLVLLGPERDLLIESYDAQATPSSETDS